MDSTIWQVLFFSLIGGVISLVGGILLLSKKNTAQKVAIYATPFAAGALLAAAFIDLLPEASHLGNIDKALYATLGGILFFFLLERFLRWFHHHHEHEKSDKTDPKVPLIVIGDTIHNFIDGIAIAAGFLVDPTTGIIVTLAVAAHEIPQEIGDFGLLLKKGVSRKNVILINVASALATTVAAVLFFTIGSSANIPLDIILGLVAGFFIYVAVSDIIPSIHKSEEKILAGPQTLLLLIGVLVVGSMTTYLHQFIDTDTHETGTHSSEVHSEDELHTDEVKHSHDEESEAHTE
jgi:zinc and cadmium transporter